MEPKSGPSTTQADKTTHTVRRRKNIKQKKTEEALLIEARMNAEQFVREPWRRKVQVSTQTRYKLDGHRAITTTTIIITIKWNRFRGVLSFSVSFRRSHTDSDVETGLSGFAGGVRGYFEWKPACLTSKVGV